MNNEALQIAEEVKRDDTIFECKVLKAKIEYQGGRVSEYQSTRTSDYQKSDTVKQLKNMLLKCKKDSEVATLHHELFKMTGKKTHKTSALTLYRKLYKKSPAIHYKERIEELENFED